MAYPLKKNDNLTIRIDEDLKNDLEQMEKETSINRSDFARAGLEAAIKFYKENKYIYLPYKILPVNE